MVWLAVATGTFVYLFLVLITCAPYSFPRSNKLDGVPQVDTTTSISDTMRKPPLRIKRWGSGYMLYDGVARTSETLTIANISLGGLFVSSTAMRDALIKYTKRYYSEWIA
jgi:hypothetical protein